MLAELWCRREGCDASGGDERPKERPAHELAAPSLFFYPRNELLGHWPPLAAIWVPLGILPVASASLTICARREPEPSNVQVHKGTQPRDSHG